jgi:hypothetical protein
MPIITYQDTTSTPGGGKMLEPACLLEMLVDLINGVGLIVAQEDCQHFHPWATGGRVGRCLRLGLPPEGRQQR